MADFFLFKISPKHGIQLAHGNRFDCLSLKQLNNKTYISTHVLVAGCQLLTAVS